MSTDTKIVLTIVLTNKSLEVFGDKMERLTNSHLRVIQARIGKAIMRAKRDHMVEQKKMEAAIAQRMALDSIGNLDDLDNLTDLDDEVGDLGDPNISNEEGLDEGLDEETDSAVDELADLLGESISDVKKSSEELAQEMAEKTKQVLAARTASQPEPSPVTQAKIVTSPKVKLK